MHIKDIQLAQDHFDWIQADANSQKQNKNTILT